MCQICTDWESGKINSEEALKAIGKLLQPGKRAGKTHALILVDRIMKKEVPVSAPNEEAESAWWQATHKKEEDEI